MQLTLVGLNQVNRSASMNAGLGQVVYPMLGLDQVPSATLSIGHLNLCLGCLINGQVVFLYK